MADSIMPPLSALSSQLNGFTIRGLRHSLMSRQVVGGAPLGLPQSQRERAYALGHQFNQRSSLPLFRNSGTTPELVCTKPLPSTKSF